MQRLHRRLQAAAREEREHRQHAPVDRPRGDLVAGAGVERDARVGQHRALELALGEQEHVARGGAEQVGLSPWRPADAAPRRAASSSRGPAGDRSCRRRPAGWIAKRRWPSCAPRAARARDRARCPRRRATRAAAAAAAGALALALACVTRAAAASASGLPGWANRRTLPMAAGTDSAEPAGTESCEGVVWACERLTCKREGRADCPRSPAAPGAGSRRAGGRRELGRRDQRRGRHLRQAVARRDAAEPGVGEHVAVDVAQDHVLAELVGAPEPEDATVLHRHHRGVRRAHQFHELRSRVAAAGSPWRVPPPPPWAPARAPSPASIRRRGRAALAGLRPPRCVARPASPPATAFAFAVALDGDGRRGQQRAPGDLLAGHRQARVDEAGQRRDHGLRVAGDQLRAQQHRARHILRSGCRRGSPCAGSSRRRPRAGSARRRRSRRPGCMGRRSRRPGRPRRTAARSTARTASTPPRRRVETERSEP